MVVNLFFYSAKCLVYFSVVFFVVAADFANERHQYKEAATDKSHHDLSIHRIIDQGLQRLAVDLGFLGTSALEPMLQPLRRILFY